MHWASHIRVGLVVSAACHRWQSAMSVKVGCHVLAALPTQGNHCCSCCGSPKRACSRRLCMGDFPRWVEREDVDSQAMFSAYLNYLVTTGAHSRDAPGWRPVWSGHLHMINHRTDPPGVHVQPAVDLKYRDCQKRACSRCEAGVGGYQFRWYSRFWAKRYNELRRAGAWTAPEPGTELTDDPAMRFGMSRGLP